MSNLFRYLRVAFYAWKLRFQGVLADPFGHKQAVRLEQERRRKADYQRLLLEWITAAEAEGLDMSREALRQRFSMEFNPLEEREFDSESPIWRDDVSQLTPERLRELLHQRAI